MMNEVQEALDSVEEPDLDQFDFDITNDITNNDNFDSAVYSSFQTFLNTSFVLNMLLIVSILVFISYILFGKKSA